MSAPQTHLRHFEKQDLKLLWVVDNDVLLGLKLGQRLSEPYTKTTLHDEPIYHRGGKGKCSYGVPRYRLPCMYSTFEGKTGQTLSSVWMQQRVSELVDI